VAVAATVVAGVVVVGTAVTCAVVVLCLRAVARPAAVASWRSARWVWLTAATVEGRSP
jgi:hypothetical protein